MTLLVMATRPMTNVEPSLLNICQGPRLSQTADFILAAIIRSMKQHYVKHLEKRHAALHYILRAHI